MNSPVKSIMPVLTGTQNPAPSTPITMVTNTPTKSPQLSPPKNLTNYSNSSIQALVDQTKLPVSDSSKATSSNSVSSTNSLLAVSSSKATLNISNDTKPSTNDTSNSTPLVNNSTLDVKDIDKDPTKNTNLSVGKPTTNGVDTTTPVVSSILPDEKITSSPEKAHEEASKEPAPADSKSSTTKSSVVSTATPDPIPATPINSVPPAVTADSSNTTTETSSEVPASQTEPSVDAKVLPSSTSSPEKGTKEPAGQSSLPEVTKAEQPSQDTKTSNNTESDTTLSPRETLDTSVKVSVDPLKTPTKPKKQAKASPKIQEDTKQEKDPLNPDDGKPKRSRLPVQPFQSPLPELSLVTRLNNKANSEKMEEKEKLVIFYKNEFLAVRNEDGGFYVCQALQNVFKSSHRIRIRWLSQGPNNEFTPDFYDATEFDCILTCLKLTKVDKEKWKLNEQEKERVENILKRSLEVEKGEAIPALTEEHPDGLDLSLFRDESQLRKSKKTPKKGSKKISPAKKTPNTATATPSKKLETPVPSTSGAGSAKRSLRRPKRAGANISYDFDEPSSSGSDFSVKTPTKKEAVVKQTKTPVPAKKVASTPDIVAAKKKAADKTPAAKKTTATKVITPAPSVPKKKLVDKTPPPAPSSSSSSKQAAKRKATDKTPMTAAAKKQKVEALPKPKSQPATPSERSTKTRNAGSAVEAKITSAVTPSRPSRERRSGGTTKK